MNETRSRTEGVTLLLYDGESEKSEESDDSQDREDHANANEEPEAFEPGAPVVL